MKSTAPGRRWVDHHGKARKRPSGAPAAFAEDPALQIGCGEAPAPGGGPRPSEISTFSAVRSGHRPRMSARARKTSSRPAARSGDIAPRFLTTGAPTRLNTCSLLAPAPSGLHHGGARARRGIHLGGRSTPGQVAERARTRTAAPGERGPAGESSCGGSPAAPRGGRRRPRRAISTGASRLAQRAGFAEDPSRRDAHRPAWNIARRPRRHRQSRGKRLRSPGVPATTRSS